MDFGTFITYAPLPLIIFALLITWKYECSRFFLFLLLIVELIDEVLYKTSLSWTTHHYLYCMVLDIMFVVPIVYRKAISNWLYNKTGSDFFRRVCESHHYSLQEIGLLLIFGLNFVINFIVYIEIWLYKLYVIDNPYIKLIFRNPIQIGLHIFGICALLTYTVKTPLREKYYEGQNSN
ncbi:hypothetical protein AT705_21150 [Pseudoalteromonas rubra]|uniref:Uncharacterized protein n=1 Tax=Pseudoalteromonas rubra TaxID=43658 RepID=A0A0U2PED2_9GAMM|nr:hypothetical protein AT705_21150 [Pseudoalteromonas rubra]